MKEENKESERSTDRCWNIDWMAWKLLHYIHIEIAIVVFFLSGCYCQGVLLAKGKKNQAKKFVRFCFSCCLSNCYSMCVFTPQWNNCHSILLTAWKCHHFDVFYVWISKITRNIIYEWFYVFFLYFVVVRCCVPPWFWCFINRGTDTADTHTHTEWIERDCVPCLSADR